MLTYLNRLFVTADEKSVHFWNMTDGKKQKVLYLNEILKSHVTVSTITFSHRFRVRLRSLFVIKNEIALSVDYVGLQVLVPK